MKTNEAPEKLYLHPTAKGKVGASWLTFPLTNEDIEYTRTDAFIEKVKEWLDTKDDRNYYTIGYIKNHFQELIIEYEEQERH